MECQGKKVHSEPSGYDSDFSRRSRQIEREKMRTGRIVQDATSNQFQNHITGPGILIILFMFLYICAPKLTIFNSRPHPHHPYFTPTLEKDFQNNRPLSVTGILVDRRLNLSVVSFPAHTHFKLATSHLHLVSLTLSAFHLHLSP